MNKTAWITFLISLVILCLLIPGCGKKQSEESAGINWISDIDQGLALAADNGKPVMVDFMATWCPPCHKMEDSTFSNPKVIKLAEKFVTVRIDVDEQGEIANQYNGNASKYGGVGIPNILFMRGDGKTIAHPVGYKNPDKFLALMDSVLQVIRQ